MIQEQTYRKVAFITYNQIGKGGLSSGWHERNGRHAFALQNTKGRGALEGPEDMQGDIGETERIRQIYLLWNELDRAISELDHIVIYLGDKGSLDAVRRAATLDASKVTFVTCSCGLSAKAELIRRVGLINAGCIDCCCGGHSEMKHLFEHFLDTGRLSD